MEKSKKILAGSLITGSVLSLGALQANAATFNYTDLGTGSQVRAELLRSERSLTGAYELSCGEKKAEGKTTEAKCGEKKAESKSAEHKCGEGKCGEKKAEGSSESKSAEHKCGEGKCGEKKAASTESKSSEHKCGEGKCGEGKKK